MAKKQHIGFDFETALQELEGIVSKMEKGDLSLEDSLKHFETGLKLTRQCQKAIESAEQKVQILLNQDPSTLQEFDAEG